MISLTDLLTKYQNLRPTDSLKKKAAVEVVAALFGLELKLENVSLANNIIYLKVSTKLKAEVLLHKNEIMERLRAILGKESPRDIK